MKNTFLYVVLLLVLPCFLFSMVSFAVDNTEALKAIELAVQKGNLDSAEKDVKKILETDKTNSWAIRTLANIYRMQFESSKNKKLLNLAKTEIEKALEYSPNDLWVNVHAAFIYYDLKNKVKATKSIDKVINSNSPVNKADWVKNLKAEIEAIK